MVFDNVFNILTNLKINDIAILEEYLTNKHQLDNELNKQLK